MSRLFLRSSRFLLVTGLLMSYPTVFAQDSAVATTAQKVSQPPESKAVIFTTQQDHQDMLKQLGITELRPGRRANENAANGANYSEAKANPYPDLPDVMKLSSGERVTSPEQWWRTRRPEIVELLEREVYGRIPGNVPRVKWEVRETREIKAGGKPAIQKHLIGVVDNAACPEMTLALCAPRLTFISHGIPERGDAKWLDHQGSFMAAIAAQPVFRLLGARDLGRSDDFKTEKMPAVNVDMLDGALAWRQHDGGHTDEPNVEHFITWADKHFARADGKDVTAATGAAGSVVSRPSTPRAVEVPDAVRIKRPTAKEVAIAEKRSRISRSRRIRRPRPF